MIPRGFCCICATRRSCVVGYAAIRNQSPDSRLAAATDQPQLTQLVDAPPDGDDWLHEIKYDGYRMMARLDHGAVKLLTRTGLDWTHK